MPGTSPEDLRNLFEEYATDYILEGDVIEAAENEFRPKILSRAIKDRERALGRIDSVLDLFIDLGYLAVKGSIIER